MIGPDSRIAIRNRYQTLRQPSIFADSLRDARHKVVAHDDHIPRADRTGNQHRPDCVQQVQRLHQQVIWYDTAIEPHGQRNHQREEFSHAKFPARQGICSNDRHENIDSCSSHHIKQRIGIAGKKLIIRTDQLIALQLKADWQESQLALTNGHRIAERGRNRP